jgi:hypothetical protein
MPNAPSSLVDQFTMSLRGISPMIWRRLLGVSAKGVPNDTIR